LHNDNPTVRPVTDRQFGKYPTKIVEYDDPGFWCGEGSQLETPVRYRKVRIAPRSCLTNRAVLRAIRSGNSAVEPGLRSNRRLLRPGPPWDVDTRRGDEAGRQKRDYPYKGLLSDSVGPTSRCSRGALVP
jgi:hypothetical protein